MKEKKCKDCGITKPAKDYYKQNNVLQYYCKKCSIKRASAWSKTEAGVRNRHNQDKRRRAYRQTPEGKAENRKHALQHYKAHPERAKARSALRQKIRDGKIKRGDCLICGEQNGQAHHEDYSKPFDVMWLCEGCHREYHFNQNQKKEVCPIKFSRNIT